MSALIGNWVQMSTSSTGTGALTLTTKTGYPTIQQLASGLYGLSSGTLNVQYDIVDTASGTPQFESGIGSFNLGTGVLTRTLPQKTFDGTTYDATAPAALNFATAANVTVMLSALVERSGSFVVPGIPNTALFGASTAVNARPLNISGVNSTATMTADREHYSPIYWPYSNQITKAGIYYSSTTGNAKVAWYEVNSDGTPGTKILADTVIALTAGSAINTATITGFCPAPGWYWQGVIFSAASVVGKCDTVQGILSPKGLDGTMKPMWGHYKAGSYATGLTGPTTGTTESGSSGVWSTPGFAFGWPDVAYLVAA